MPCARWGFRCGTGLRSSATSSPTSRRRPTPMSGPGTELTVGAVTRHYARVAPAKCALYDGERSLAYGEVDAMVDALASALVRDGVARGDVVSAYLPNCIDYIVVVLAVARAGATFSPINPRYKAFEVAA